MPCKSNKHETFNIYIPPKPKAQPKAEPPLEPPVFLTICTDGLDVQVNQWDSMVKAEADFHDPGMDDEWHGVCLVTVNPSAKGS